MTNLVEAISAKLTDDKARVAIDAGERVWTAGAFDADIRAAAGALKRLGVKKGDRVAAQVEKSVEAAALFFGTLRIGAAFLPLNTAYQKGEIGYFLSDAEPTLLVCDPKDHTVLAPVAAAAGVQHVRTLDADGRGTWHDEIEAADPYDPIEQMGANDLAGILYTSGTTGRSKGAMVTHGNLLSNARTLVEIWGFRPDDVLLHALPTFHIHGLFVALNTSLLNGSKILWLPKFDPDAVFERLPEATVFMGVPTYYTRLLSDPRFTREATQHMRLFVSGSAPLLVDTFEAFERRTGQRILERYGMTEAGMICSNPLAGPRRAGTVGKPLPGVELRIGDGEGGVRKPGEVGVIEVRGPNVFVGYWRLPEKTAAEFRAGGFFITGDMGTIDAEDGYVSVVGRAKDLIICGGLNVYPKEIEDVIDAMDGVQETAVIGLPHPDFGEAVAAVVKPRPGAALDGAAIAASLKGEMANFKVPKRVWIVDDLPRNAMGKVQKNVLRDQYKDTFGK
jgi:malonyl-CoA/methylmalonyl-CoA synthetase